MAERLPEKASHDLTAEELLAKRLARPEDANDPLGGFKGGIQFGFRYTEVAIAIVTAVVGAVIVWQAAAIARAIDSFIGHGQAADPGTFWYALLGWCLIGVAILAIAANFLLPPMTFEIREKGLRYKKGPRRLELPWNQVRDVQVKETEHIHAEYGSQYKEQDVVIQTNQGSIVIPGVAEENFYVTDILLHHWSKSGAGYDSPEGDLPRQRAPAKPGQQSTGANLPKLVAQKLAAGESAKDVMAWLQERHNLPRPAAEKVLAQAFEYNAD